MKQKSSLNPSSPIYALVRCAFLLLVGILLVAWRSEALTALVRLLGALFLLPGLVSVVSYFIRKDRGWFPVVGTGSTFLGLILLIIPGTFVSVLMFMLGLMLVFVGIWQIVGVVAMHRESKLSFGFLVMPVAVLITGIVALALPFEVATLPLLIIGVGCILTGISDLVAIIFHYIRRPRKAKYVENDTAAPRLDADTVVEAEVEEMN